MTGYCECGQYIWFLPWWLGIRQCKRCENLAMEVLLQEKRDKLAELKLESERMEKDNEKLERELEKREKELEERIKSFTPEQKEKWEQRTNRLEWEIWYE